jgi:hypothetical protein
VAAKDLGLAIAHLKPIPSEVCISPPKVQNDVSVSLGSLVEVLLASKMPVSLYTDPSFSLRVWASRGPRAAQPSL